MNFYSVPARIGYAIVSFPIGAILGYILMLQLLIRIGTVFHDPHPSMQGFGYFMMSLASAAILGVTFSLITLTMPWRRPAKKPGTIARATVSVVFVLFAFVILAGQGNALIFTLAMSLWLMLVAGLTYVRHGVLDLRSEDPKPVE